MIRQTPSYWVICSLCEDHLPVAKTSKLENFLFYYAPVTNRINGIKIKGKRYCSDCLEKEAPGI